MKINIVHSGYFKLDGGAMFGVVPFTMWKKLNPPDESHLCPWAMRSLLIETGDRKILVDTGMGDKQDAKFKSHFHPHGEESLTTSLKKLHLTPEDITDVFHTHLHFDHCGGSIVKNEDGSYALAFPNATYWSNQKHWDTAINPNARERASFLKENILPMEASGKLKMIPVEDNYEWIPGIKVRISNGHTEAMMMLQIETDQGTYLYAADLFPSKWHIPMPYVMAYDIRPLVTLEEKTKFLEEALIHNYRIIFEHDPFTEAGTIKRNDRGRIVFDQEVPV